MPVTRYINEWFTFSSCWLKRNRSLDPGKMSQGDVKINLGCGLAVAPDWINIDGSLNAFFAGWPVMFHKAMYRLTGANRYYSLSDYCHLMSNHLFLHHDLAYGIPLIDESVDFVYSSHFLEHMMRDDARRLLQESHRVLKPGGIVRVCLPDLAFAFSLYQKGEKERLLRNYFFVEDKESYYARHKYMYDFELLKKALEAVGFKDVKEYSFQKGQTPDLDILDNRPEDTLFAEAIKT